MGIVYLYQPGMVSMLANSRLYRVGHGPTPDAMLAHQRNHAVVLRYHECADSDTRAIANAVVSELDKSFVSTGDYYTGDRDEIINRFRSVAEDASSFVSK